MKIQVFHGLHFPTSAKYSMNPVGETQLIVPLLYYAARLAHMDARRNYKRLINISEGKISLNTATSEAQFLEKDILKHSRALLILSPDFGSVWNSRKLVLSREPDLSVLLDELNLSLLVLSYSPKSEQAWSHRRWVIKKIAEKFHDLYDIIGKESEFVKRIAEKSKMNYRAWNHRCWLILYMNKWQMFNELDKSRTWAELHVADNCCYHYRRRLILNLLGDNSLKYDEENPSFYKCHPVDLLQEELKWNEHLIKQYVGREALWIHRRYLSYYWLTRITNDFPCKDEQEMIPSLNSFLKEEMELLQSCLNFPADEFDDAQAQARHAATYILWISKKIILSPEYRFQEKLVEAGDLKTILMNTSPEKSLIWERLLDQLPAEVENICIC
ncbi:protein prenyltransferase alpha subunit repeat-containing protein 1 isoform X2 [Phalaenopsis equestris]|uniref:protein prenyltransferase alpha subunit repeat-containing protein 1 isoform X2 n=1 Tax=Phalaenopsis equestris TaxID=78828 RepID=UPI0009E3B053|nr:protein prenyltransferase alpha subunit repeat-containing protein 1 isoform X2 [Phalaenopsis equestris]XP_020577696.1 protein prenyltransferase alpha subunit repeat-containing protein 1 isoform X2 [Phalaenopsis equestris]XP_020577697.1 protein prenyltransferase alpha subunit repeat-containing protein 1 isoform X2 [Phalaenopsis equestris]XP_020577698.1 protein prenyltransferase alpha subunit repeat-containing protein 1 isoform X2 [Phalaenopsis equestris]XP_020577699.1 protein prenyltransferas